MISNKKEVKPFVLAAFGQQGSGKTYNIEKFANSFKGTVLVYNFGTEKDWKKYKIIEFIEHEDSNKKNNTLKFKFKNIIYDFEKDFIKMFKGKKVKALSMDSQAEQELLFRKLAKSQNLQNILFIIDDATAVLPQNLTLGLRMLLSKSKHNKVFIIIITHAFNLLTPRAYNLLTHLRIFKTVVPPSSSKIGEMPLKEYIPQIYEDLFNAPPYTYYTMEVQENRITKTVQESGQTKNLIIKI